MRTAIRFPRYPRVDRRAMSPLERDPTVVDNPLAEYMVALEPEEKAAGRLYRSRAQADLEQSFITDPPYYRVPGFIAHYRHECPANAGRSMSLEMHEVYLPSPRFTVEINEIGLCTAYLYSEWTPRDVDLWQIPAGRFGFVYRQGKCRACRRTARSPAGRLVDAWQRPPLQGGISR